MIAFINGNESTSTSVVAFDSTTLNQDGDQGVGANGVLTMRGGIPNLVALEPRNVVSPVDY